MSGSRLEAFEDMLAAVKNEYADILSKMEKMKTDGKVKTVTYQQMMSRKLLYRNMLSLYEIYGLTEKEGEEYHPVCGGKKSYRPVSGAGGRHEVQRQAEGI